MRQQSIHESNVITIPITVLKLSVLVSVFSGFVQCHRTSFLPLQNRRNMFLRKNNLREPKQQEKSSFRKNEASTIKKYLANILHQRGGGIEDSKRDKKGFEKLKKDIIPEPYFELAESNKISLRRGVILVDSFCPYHGKYLDRMAREAYGCAVVNVLSNYLTGYLYFARGVTEHISMRIPEEGDVKQWTQEIPFGIAGIICESDSGLADAEKLGDKLGLAPHRHDGFNEARRNKFLMNKCVAEHGLRVVRQKMCSTLTDAVNFATELGVCNLKSDDDKYESNKAGCSLENSDNDNMEKINSGLLGRASNISHELSPIGKYCVIKPFRGVASDDVYFCPNIDAVEDAFEKVHGSVVFGSTTGGERHESVLVQEFAVGTEYAVDIVSKAGEHKCAVLWRYDKRPVNGATFVYFATEVVDAHTPNGQVICEYAKKALDALGVNWGISHTEIIVDKDGPRLVEVNCRQHNTDFAPLTTACMGYNALDMLLSAYLGDEPELPEDTADMRQNWSDTPDLPVSRTFGAIVHLVCHVEGIINKVHEEVIEEIESLPSVMAMEVYPDFSLGNKVEKTINIRSDSGWVHLINTDEEQFQRDYNRIVELMPLMFSVSE